MCNSIETRARGLRFEFELEVCGSSAVEATGLRLERAWWYWFAVWVRIGLVLATSLRFELVGVSASWFEPGLNVVQAEMSWIELVRARFELFERGSSAV